VTPTRSLKRKKGRKQCSVNKVCSPRSVAVGYYYTDGGHPMAVALNRKYAISKLKKERVKLAPICNQCKKAIKSLVEWQGLYLKSLAALQKIEENIWVNQWVTVEGYPNKQFVVSLKVIDHHQMYIVTNEYQLRVRIPFSTDGTRYSDELVEVNPR